MTQREVKQGFSVCVHLDLPRLKNFALLESVLLEGRMCLFVSHPERKSQGWIATNELQFMAKSATHTHTLSLSD